MDGGEVTVHMTTMLMMLLSASLLASPDAGQDGLRAQVDAEREVRPAAFEQVDALRRRAAARPMDARARVAVARQLMALGDAGVLPMLELIALRQDKLAELPATSRTGFEAAMLETLKDRKDPRAAPVFRAVMDRPAKEPLVRDAAAAGLGALCRDDDVTYLASRANAGDTRQSAALHGLGFCRHGRAATVLLDTLDRASSGAEAARAAEALGWLGSSWAWQALGAQRRAEGDGLRASIAPALARAWFKHPQERKQVDHALVMVSHPAAAAELTRLASGSDAATARDAARLAARLERRAR